MISISDITDAIAGFAPLYLQESWDNSGLQVGDAGNVCTGVLLCVDVTPDIIAEAVSRGCNLVVAHHPLLFKGLKRIAPGDNVVQQSVIDAIRNDIAVYSCHTPLDSVATGISARMAAMLGANVIKPLSLSPVSPTAGLGVVAELREACTPQQFVDRVKHAFGSTVVRCSQVPSYDIKRFALCGGSGGEFISDAIEAGATAYLSSDIRYHDFVDYGKRIFLCDIGHFEAEACAKDILCELISKKFPNFAVYKSDTESNSIKYL